MEENITYNYVSAPAGSGKTYAAVRHAVELAKLGAKIIIAQPSKNCIAEWHPKTQALADKQTKCSITLKRFDSDVCEQGTTFSSIIENMANPTGHGEIIFITHAALLGITDWPFQDEWHLIVDEIPAIDKFFDKHLPINHNFLIDAISWFDHSTSDYQVYPKDKELLLRYERNDQGDEIDKLFQEIARCILHPYYKVYAARENLERSLSGDTVDGKYPLYLFGLLQPEVFQGFQTTTIMGANFTESILYMVWGLQGVDFIPHKKITKSLRYTEHPNGERLEIYYLTDDKWSKHLSKKSIDINGKQVSNNEVALEAVKEVVSGIRTTS